jgi:two-component system response regulator FixJ
MSKRLFFVDDEPVIRKAVALSLSQLDADVHCFSSGLACIEAIENFGCDVLVTDINMPGMSGLELIRSARTFKPSLHIIAITGYGDVPMAVSAMKAGAIDFIEKPLDESTFIPAVQRALGTESPTLGSEHSLTQAEINVLSFVVAGFTNKEIADRLGRSVRTVENHRHRLCKKLDANNTAELVRTAIKLGIQPVQD